MITLKEVLNYVDVEMEETPRCRDCRCDQVFDGNHLSEDFLFWREVADHYIKEGYEELNDVLESISSELFTIKLKGISKVDYYPVEGRPPDPINGPPDPLARS